MGETYNHFAEVYDEASTAIAEWTWRNGILAVLSESQPGLKSLLDLGCGTGVGGRLLKGLGLANLVGLDRSHQMLYRATPHYDQILRRNITQPLLKPRSFDYIVSGFDTLNYLSPSELSLAFKCARVLFRDKSSRLIFDYSSPHLLQKNWRDLKYTQGLDQDRTLLWYHQYEAAEACTSTSITLVCRGVAHWTERHMQYTMHPDRIAEVAKGAGLTIEKVRNLESDHYSEDVRTHVYVLRQII